MVQSADSTGAAEETGGSGFLFKKYRVAVHNVCEGGWSGGGLSLW